MMVDEQVLILHPALDVAFSVNQQVSCTGHSLGGSLCEAGVQAVAISCIEKSTGNSPPRSLPHAPTLAGFMTSTTRQDVTGCFYRSIAAIDVE